MNKESGFSIAFLTVLLHFSNSNHIVNHPTNIFTPDSLCSGNSTVTVKFEIIGSKSYGTVAAERQSHSHSYPKGLNCTLLLVAPPGYQLHLSFSDIHTRPGGVDKITVNHSRFENVTVLTDHRSCPSENCLDLEFDGDEIIIQFTSASNGSDPDETMTGFMGMVTVFSTADEIGNCHTKEQFRCRNRHCIWKGLFCNKHNHCGDESDEPTGCQPFAEQAIWGILVIVFGAVSLCVFLPLFCYFAIRGQRRKMQVTRSLYQPINHPSINGPQPDANYATTLMGSFTTPSSFYGANYESSNESNKYPTNQQPYH